MGQADGRKSSGSRPSAESSVSFLTDWLEAQRSASTDPIEDSGIPFHKLADAVEGTSNFANPGPDLMKASTSAMGDYQLDMRTSVSQSSCMPRV